jgi:hypothetical protein
MAGGPTRPRPATAFQLHRLNRLNLLRLTGEVFQHVF